MKFTFGLKKKKKRAERCTPIPVLSTTFLKPILQNFAYLSNLHVDLLKIHSTSDTGKLQYKHYTKQSMNYFNVKNVIIQGCKWNEAVTENITICP